MLCQAITVRPGVLNSVSLGWDKSCQIQLKGEVDVPTEPTAPVWGLAGSCQPGGRSSSLTPSLCEGQRRRESVQSPKATSSRRLVLVIEWEGRCCRGENHIWLEIDETSLRVAASDEENRIRLCALRRCRRPGDSQL